MCSGIDEIMLGVQVSVLNSGCLITRDRFVEIEKGVCDEEPGRKLDFAGVPGFVDELGVAEKLFS